MKKVICTVLGAPNCGKSTFINYLVQKKYCIVSDRPHTTRENTMAVLVKNNCEISFIDTPGVNVLRTKYSMAMKQISLKVINKCDLQIFIFDCLNRCAKTF